MGHNSISTACKQEMLLLISEMFGLKSLSESLTHFLVHQRRREDLAILLFYRLPLALPISHQFPQTNNCEAQERQLNPNCQHLVIRYTKDKETQK